MKKTAASTIDVRTNLSEPWKVPADLLDALASFDRIVAEIDGVVVIGGVVTAGTERTVDLRLAA